MPDGRENRVELLVATIPALLVMKGYALVARDKKKDAYDIYYSVRNYPGGPGALAGDCMPRPCLLMKWPARGLNISPGNFVKKRILDQLRSEESSGLGVMTPEQVQMDAFMQVSTWLRALGLAIS